MREVRMTARAKPTVDALRESTAIAFAALAPDGVLFSHEHPIGPLEGCLDERSRPWYHTPTRTPSLLMDRRAMRW